MPADKQPDRSGGKVTNSAEDVSGQVVQARDIHGNVVQHQHTHYHSRRIRLWPPSLRSGRWVLLAGTATAIAVALAATAHLDNPTDPASGTDAAPIASGTPDPSAPGTPDPSVTGTAASVPPVPGPEPTLTRPRTHDLEIRELGHQRARPPSGRTPDGLVEIAVTGYDTYPTQATVLVTTPLIACSPTKLFVQQTLTVLDDYNGTWSRIQLRYVTWVNPGEPHELVDMRIGFQVTQGSGTAPESTFTCP